MDHLQYFLFWKNPHEMQILSSHFFEFEAIVFEGYKNSDSFLAGFITFPNTRLLEFRMKIAGFHNSEFPCQKTITIPNVYYGGCQLSNIFFRDFPNELHEGLSEFWIIVWRAIKIPNYIFPLCVLYSNSKSYFWGFQISEKQW